ncbi:MAG: hypothetical protein HY017_05050 [Betaproteobacteria bacterium]|nr:hypothetical protein [Betaproteobacteria bacterium]
MSWLRNMVGKPRDDGTVRARQATSPAAASAQAPVLPPVDWDRLRQSIAAAANGEERTRRERELGRACAARGLSPLPVDAPAVWVEAVCHASDKATAADWSGRLKGDESLAEAAMHCRFAEIRLAAARRITDLAVLKQLADANRDKDKHVYRHCTDALRAHRHGGARARRAAELALAVRALLEARPVAVSRLLHLEKEIAALGKGGEVLAECMDLLAQAQGCVLKETQAQIGLRDRLAAVMALRFEIAGAQWPPGDRLAAWQHRYADIVYETASSPAWLAKFPAGRELARVLQEIESRLGALALDVTRAAECERFLEAPLPDEGIEAWAALPKPDTASVRAALEARWATIQARAAPPAIEPPPVPKARKSRKPRIDQAELQRSLEELEQHLDEGRLAEADGVASRIEHAIGAASLGGLPARRWQSARAQLARLHGWARWGTDQAREHLIAEAEALLGSEPDMDERARAVPALHKEWKRLDAHGLATKALWARFDAALEKTYQPVLEQRAVEAVRQEAARVEKAAQCEAWEAWFEQFSAAAPQYMALAAKREEIAAHWRSRGALAGFRDERKLRRRRDGLLKRMDALLEEAQAKEAARREQIALAAEALRDEPEISKAVNEARSLQIRWKDEPAIVRMRHGTEHKLWQRFRAACDAVFARRDAIRNEQVVQREQRDQARNAEQQARDLKRAAERDAALSQKARHAGRFALMAQKAALAEPVEAAAVGGEPADALLAAAREAWEGLARLQGTADRVLRARLDAAVSARAESLAKGRAARAALLIDLEIALELPTPESDALARRARSLSRLQERFRSGGPAAQEPEAMVAQWHAIGAVPDDGQYARMAAIVRRLLERGG